MSTTRGSGPELKLLALDTSTEYCSAALLCDAELTHSEAHAVQRHSELILPMIEQLLSAAGVTLTQLDGIAFGSGPGSFTGLRIACGVAQGLAFGAGLPVVPVGTLLALAEEADALNVISCLDARMGEVYHAVYRREQGRWSEIEPPGVGPVESMPEVRGGGWFGILAPCNHTLRESHDAHPVRTGKPQYPMHRDAVARHPPMIEAVAHIWQRDMINSLYWFYG